MWRTPFYNPTHKKKNTEEIIYFIKQNRCYFMKYVRGGFEVFPEKYDVKITVLKRLFHKDLVNKYTDNPSAWGPCQKFREGQS